MSSSTRLMASVPSDLNPLIKKCSDPDADIRYMVLGDICSMLLNSSPNLLSNDNSHAPQLVSKVVERLDDSNGDVQSQALKTVGPLASKINAELLRKFLIQLVSVKTDKSLDESIYIIAARTVVTSLPQPMTTNASTKDIATAYAAVKDSVLQRLLGQATSEDSNARGLLDIYDATAPNTEGIELARQVILCYGSILPDNERRLLLHKLLALVDDSRVAAVAQKKAVAALAALAVYLSESSFQNELVIAITKRLDPRAKPDLQSRMCVTLVGSLARAVPHRLGSSLKSLVPLLLATIHQDQFDTLTQTAQEDAADTRAEGIVEASLMVLDDLFACCNQVMREYTNPSIDASLQFMTYDPNLVEQIEDEESMDDDDEFTAEDENLDGDDAMSDSDDSSWKIRRCAAKVLHTIIRTRAGIDLLDSGVLYDHIAPVLIKRFNEREESVRLEIITALALLVRLTSDTMRESSSSPTRHLRTSLQQDFNITRKRRRSSSGAFRSQLDNLNRGTFSPRNSPSPTTGPMGDLAKFAPQITQAAVEVLRQKSVPSKHAAILLLKDLVHVRHGKLDEQLGQTLPPVMDVIQTTNTSLGGTLTAPIGNGVGSTVVTLRIEALKLTAAVCDNHNSKALAPHISSITKATVAAVEDAHFKIAAEAVTTSESVAKVLTPPRSLSSTEKAHENLIRLFEVLVKKAQAHSVELEVRMNAIHALGIMLARTGGHPELLTTEDRSRAASTIQERLKNEVTRLATIEAVDCIASGEISEEDYMAEWLRSVCVELANQLRKADRTLSASSLSTLQNLLSQKVVVLALDDKTSQILTQLLLPLLTSHSMGQLPLSLTCMAQLIKSSSSLASDNSVINTIAGIAATQLSGPSIDAYLDLVEIMGSSGAGKLLIGQLLQGVGVDGPPDITGAAIGTLLAAGGSNLGVGYSDIVMELQSTKDDKRKALALAVLGQYGLRMGPSSPIQPDIFLPDLDGRTEVARSAAIALGRAGATNASKFLPVILRTLRDSTEKRQSTLLLAVREILAHGSQAQSEISSRADELWGTLMQLSVSEDNRAVGAECVGKLVVMLPKRFLPQLQAQLLAGSTDTRGLVIQAIRYAVVDSDSSLDDVLKPMVADMLTLMLNDTDLDNRRLSLMTLNATTSAKPAVVAPYIHQLSQIVVERTKVDPSLVREIQMGPFKHKVDDGLEIRKSAYETMHALINTAYMRVDSANVFDRVIEGLGDEHDIKTLCTLLAGKLLSVDCEQVARHIHEFVAKFQLTLSFKLKDNAVKQEIERQQEAVKDVLKLTLKFNEAFAREANLDPVVWQSWKAFMEGVYREHRNALAQAAAEFAIER